MCGEKLPIPIDTKSLINFIGVICNFDGSLDNNDRIKLLENIDNLGNYNEDDETENMVSMYLCILLN